MARIKTRYYILNDNCAGHVRAIQRALRLVRDNIDIIREWYDTVGKPGTAFERRFDGRRRLRFTCKNFKMYGRGVPPGMELGRKYLENLKAARLRASGKARTCLDIDLSAVIVHEVLHLCGHSGERTAWSLEAWWRAKITRRLGLSGTAFCFQGVTAYPRDGKWKLSLKQIKRRVHSAVRAS